jgi:hypothetical protein
LGNAMRKGSAFFTNSRFASSALSRSLAPILLIENLL